MSKIPLTISIKNARSCDGCTKCCDGWLVGKIAGEMMYPGKPCQFCQPGVGCSNYDNRPQDPCRTFMCLWREDETVPIEFKPSEVNSIISRQEVDGIPFLGLQEAGETMRPEVLDWFIKFVTSRQINAEWEIDGKRSGGGSPEFVQAMQNRK